MLRLYKIIIGICFFVFLMWLMGPRYVNEIIDIHGLNKVQAMEKLSKDGVVNKYTLEFLLKATNKHIEYGEYRFRGFVWPFGVFDKITKGKFLTYKITIPEGFDMYEIASRLQKYGICSKNDFLKYATDKAFIKSLGLDQDTMEGYLFPDTYNFYKYENPKYIIEYMYLAFKENMKKHRLNPTKEQMVIASIVEKEAKFDKDKPMVASVIYNRLKKNMSLQMDSSVIYALKTLNLWNGTMTRKDIFVKSPYNTYMNHTLPPTPICNPGVHSIEAAINPAHTDYLYFVDDKDGHLIFNKSLKNHQKAVEALR